MNFDIRKDGRTCFFDLLYNNFKGQIFSSKNLTRLADLDLSNNNISGQIPSSLFTFPNLERMKLGSVLDAPPVNFRNASLCRLNSNKLQGQIPISIFELLHLYFLDLSSNNFNGTVNIAMLQNLRGLEFLRLSDNRLSINVGDVNSSSVPHLRELRLRSCNLTGFPDFSCNSFKIKCSRSFVEKN